MIEMCCCENACLDLSPPGLEEEAARHVQGKSNSRMRAALTRAQKKKKRKTKKKEVT